MSVETAAELLARLESALAARARLRRRPLAESLAALGAAAVRWREDSELRAALPSATRLSPAQIATAVDFAAEGIDPAVMTGLVEREWGVGAAARPAPEGPALVAHVLASNVPALALPAIALGCLAGAAVLVKSGRHDPLSAPAFRRALAAVDAELATTVVTTYWPGGDLGCEDVALGRADVVVVTGSDATLAALAARVRGRLVAHGPRVSVAAVARAADAELAAEALALDVALHDQRGCLSPHAVYVEGDAGGFAERLAAALDALAERLPRGAASAEERAAARVFAAEAEWEPATALRAGPGGTLVLHEAAAPLRPTCGLRTLRVHPLARLEALADLLPEGETECVGVAGLEGAPLATALRARGVSRVCRLGRMQRPRLSWPRGQHAPLGILLGRHAEAALEVDA